MKGKKPRRLFRRRGPDRHAVNIAVTGALIRDHADKLRPGSMCRAKVWHEPQCMLPRGYACICAALEVELQYPLDPARD